MKLIQLLVLMSFVCNYQIAFSQDTITTNDSSQIIFDNNINITSSKGTTLINSINFNVGNFTNPYQLIQGKIPGLLISKPSGNPLGLPQVALRGFNSTQFSNQPLIVVNGVPDFDWTTLDLNDIEAIQIIRDAASAAIYGARANDGVLLITTKTNQNKGLNINYNTFFSIDKALRIPEVLSAAEYRERMMNNGGIDRGSSTDWFEEITRIAQSHVHNLAFSGNVLKTDYRLSLNYRDIQGIALNNNLNQLSSNLNIQRHFLKDRIKFQLFYNTTQKGFDDVDSKVFGYALNYNPTAAVYNEALPEFGGYEERFIYDYYNPVSILNQNVNNNLLTSNSIQTSLSFKVFENIHFSNTYAFQNNALSNGFYAPNTSFYLGYDRNGLGIRNKKTSINHFVESKLQYHYHQGKHNIITGIGYNFQRRISETQFAEVSNYSTNNFTHNTIEFVSDSDSEFYHFERQKSAYRIISLFGNISYDYKNLLYASVNYRRDGSSRFGINNRWGNFYGITTGINFNKLLKSDWVSNLDFNLGYGKTGGLPSGDYDALALFAPSNLVFYNGNYIQGYNQILNSNPNLKWESNHEFNAGIDIGLFDNLLSVNVNYFNSNASLINKVNVNVPPNPAPFTYLNIGSIRANGIELSLVATILNKENLYWSITSHLTSISNTLTELFGTEGQYGFFSGPGISGQNSNFINLNEEIGQIWGLHFLNIDNRNWVFEDVNNDGQINEYDDGQVIGNGLPKAYYGLNNQFKFKSFDITFLLRGALGHQIANENRLFYQNQYRFNEYNVMSATFDAPHIQLLQPNTWSDYFLENGSFLKLEYFNIGYTTTFSTLKVRFFSNINNLFTITKYTGTSPEVRLSSNENTLLIGRDRRNEYLPTRTFIIGAKLTF